MLSKHLIRTMCVDLDLTLILVTLGIELLTILCYHLTQNTSLMPV